MRKFGELRPARGRRAQAQRASQEADSSAAAEWAGALQQAAGNRAASGLIALAQRSRAPSRSLLQRAPAPYGTAIATLAGGAGAAGANLQAALTGKVWPAPPGPPQINVIQDGALPGNVAAHIDTASNPPMITLRRGPAHTDADVLDAMLFEVNNALNPELAAANALPKSDPVQTRGQSKAAAEFYTWKDTVGDLITQFAAGQAANLPALIAGNFPPNAPVALPAMALSYAQRWVNTYEPIYVAHGIAHGTPAAAAFAHVAPATLVPFPAIAPLPGGLNARVAAEQAALLAWFQGAHNPAPPPDQFYLAQLSTPNVYSYEQVREWNMAQMGNYLKGVQRAGAPAPLGNTAINQAAYTQYRPYWRDWADDRGLKPLRPYLFVQIMQGIDAAGAVLPQFMPTAPMIATATDDAARIIASKYADQLARRTIVGVKPLVAADANLQNAINALLAPNPPLNLPAWRQ